MATARSFEELEVWQSARSLVKDVYLATQSGAFARDFGLRDQLRRAAISIVSNIAEAFERSGNPEFSRFLSIAKGSAGEVRAQLYLALDLDYLSKKDFGPLNERVISISRQISGLITYLDRSRVEKRESIRSRAKDLSPPSTLNL